MKIYIQKQYINQIPVLIINNNNKKTIKQREKARNAKMHKKHMSKSLVSQSRSKYQHQNISMKIQKCFSLTKKQN